MSDKNVCVNIQMNASDTDPVPELDQGLQIQYILNLAKYQISASCPPSSEVQPEVMSEPPAVIAAPPEKVAEPTPAPVPPTVPTTSGVKRGPETDKAIAGTKWGKNSICAGNVIKWDPKYNQAPGVRQNIFKGVQHKIGVDERRLARNNINGDISLSARVLRTGPTRTPIHLEPELVFNRYRTTGHATYNIRAIPPAKLVNLALTDLGPAYDVRTNQIATNKLGSVLNHNVVLPRDAYAVVANETSHANAVHTLEGVAAVGWCYAIMHADNERLGHDTEPIVMANPPIYIDLNVQGNAAILFSHSGNNTIYLRWDDYDSDERNAINGWVSAGQRFQTNNVAAPNVVHIVDHFVFPRYQIVWWGNGVHVVPALHATTARTIRRSISALCRRKGQNGAIARGLTRATAIVNGRVLRKQIVNPAVPFVPPVNPIAHAPFVCRSLQPRNANMQVWQVTRGRRLMNEIYHPDMTPAEIARAQDDYDRYCRNRDQRAILGRQRQHYRNNLIPIDIFENVALERGGSTLLSYVDYNLIWDWAGATTQFVPEPEFAEETQHIESLDANQVSLQSAAVGFHMTIAVSSIVRKFKLFCHKILICFSFQFDHYGISATDLDNFIAHDPAGAVISTQIASIVTSYDDTTTLLYAAIPAVVTDITGFVISVATMNTDSWGDLVNMGQGNFDNLYHDDYQRACYNGNPLALGTSLTCLLAVWGLPYMPVFADFSHEVQQYGIDAIQGFFPHNGEPAVQANAGSETPMERHEYPVLAINVACQHLELNNPLIHVVPIVRGENGSTTLLAPILDPTPGLPTFNQAMGCFMPGSFISYDYERNITYVPVITMGTFTPGQWTRLLHEFNTGQPLTSGFSLAMSYQAPDRRIGVPRILTGPGRDRTSKLPVSASSEPGN